MLQGKWSTRNKSGGHKDKPSCPVFSLSPLHPLRATLDALGGEYEVEAGFGETRDNYLRDNEVDTYFIVPPPHRRKPMILNTLGVRSALGAANRRKLSFRNVSNVVVQLLHSIKYSVPVPFSHMTQPGSYPGANLNSGSAVADKSHRKVREEFGMAFVLFVVFCVDFDGFDWKGLSGGGGEYKLWTV